MPGTLSALQGPGDRGLGGEATAHRAHRRRLAVLSVLDPDPWDSILYPKLDKLGFAPVVLSARGSGMTVQGMPVKTVREINPFRRIRALEALGSKVQGFAWNRKMHFVPSPFAFDDAVPGISSLLRGFDVVLAFETYRASTFQACQAHRVVVKVTENIPYNPPHVPFARLRHSVSRRARRLACVSKSSQSALLAEGVNPEKVVLIPEPVDTEVFHPSPAPSVRDRLTIGFAGIVDDRHGILDLMEAFSGLGLHQNVALRIAGTGPLLTTVNEFVRARNLESRVELLGRLPYEEMPSFLDAVDVLCVPAREVPEWKPQFGIVNIEAMAAGKPIIATRCGATPEIVPNSLQPFLVAPGDVGALRERMRVMLEDPGLRERLGRDAREWTVEHFDSWQIASMWATLLTEVIEEDGKSRAGWM